MKQLSHRFKLLPMCILMLFGLAACGKKDEIPEYVTTVGAKISDELSSGQFYLDGDMYQFPVTVGEFLENGYYVGDSYKNADTFTLLPDGQSSMFVLVKKVGDEGHNVKCKVYNPTDEELPLEECKIGWICIEAPADMMFPGGVWLKKKHEDVIAAYGEPKSFKNDSDTFYTLLYDTVMEDGSKWEVEFFMNEFRISSVTYTWEGMELD